MPNIASVRPLCSAVAIILCVNVLSRAQVQPTDTSLVFCPAVLIRAGEPGTDISGVHGIMHTLRRAVARAGEGMRGVRWMTVTAPAMCALLVILGWSVLYASQLRAERKLAAVEDVLNGVCSMTRWLEPMLEALSVKPSARFRRNDGRNDTAADHSLACVVGSEIFRLRKKIDSGSNGSESTRRTLDRLKDDLASRGYAVRDMTGLRYSDGMAVRVVNFLVSPLVKPGEERIERTIKPEICFKGTVIEPGTVEVTVSPQIAMTEAAAVNAVLEKGAII